MGREQRQMQDASAVQHRQMLQDNGSTYEYQTDEYDYPVDTYDDDLTTIKDSEIGDDPPPPPPEDPGFAPPREPDTDDVVVEPVVEDEGPVKTKFRGPIQPDDGKPSPLEISAQSGNLDELKQALKKENVNTRFESQGFQTALHIAAGKNDLEMVKVLLREGAKPNPNDGFRNTPLLVAIESRAHLKLIKLLLDSGADTSVRNAMGQTALHIAMEVMPSLGLLEELVDSGTKLNKQDIDGSTPLHIGARRGELFAVEYLLSKGADPSIRDKRGFPVIQMVCRLSCNDGSAQRISNAVEKALKEL